MSSSESERSPTYEIDGSHPENKCFRTLCHLDPGELIIAERPLFTQLKAPLDKSIDDFFKDEEEGKTHIISNFVSKQLGDDECQQFRLLYPAADGNDNVARDIDCVRCNTFSITKRENVKGGAQRDRTNFMVFNDISRINHSCVPNAMFHWDSNAKMGFVHATHHILAGSEVTITYNKDACYATRKSRRKHYLENYDFICTCPACAEDPVAPEDLVFDDPKPDMRRAENKNKVAKHERKTEAYEALSTKLRDHDDRSVLMKTLRNRLRRSCPDSGEMTLDEARKYVRSHRGSPWGLAADAKELVGMLITEDIKDDRFVEA